MSNGTGDCNTCTGYEEQIDNLQKQISQRGGDIERYQAANLAAPGTVSQEQFDNLQEILRGLYRQCGDEVENYHRHHRSAHGGDAPVQPMPANP